MTKVPEISVIIPMYQAAKFIERAVNSVLSQSFRDFELIVIDNCSQDDSYALVEKIRDERIRLFKNEENIGLNGSLNKGLSLAKGTYIKFLCADDMLRPNCLERMHAYAIAQKCELLYCNADFVDENDGYIFGQAAGKRSFSLPYNEQNAKAIFLRKKYRISCCVSFLLIKNSDKIPAFTSINGSGYNSDLLFLFDLFRAVGKIDYLNEKLLDLRLHSEQGTYVSVGNEIFERPLSFGERILQTNGFCLNRRERFRFRFSVFKNGCNAFLRYRHKIGKESFRYTLREFGFGYYILLFFYIPFVYVPKKIFLWIASKHHQRKQRKQRRKQDRS